MVKKLEDAFTRFDRIHERDRQTDGRTNAPRKWCDGTGRAMQHCAVKTRRENQITA